MTSTPLRFRVPRSPAVFVGRERELALVLDRIARGGVAVVTGVGGLGKTALACRAVEALGASGSAVFVGLRRGADVILEIGRALAVVEGYGAADWSISQRDPEGMVDSVLDLAESRGHLVMIDDLHEGSHRAEESIQRLATHCRASRWIVTSRRAPRWPGSEEMTVALSVLAPEAIEALLVSCAPQASVETLREMAAGAAGSPWRARSRLRGGSSEERITDGLSEGEIAILTRLTELSGAVPLGLLGEADAFERLRRYGLVDMGEATVRLHDVARVQLTHAGLPAAARDDVDVLMRALLVSGQPDLELEGLVLWRRHGRSPADLEPVVRRAAAWIEAGTAERAFAALEGIDDPRLVRERLICAAAVASEETLAWASAQPEPQDHGARLAWASALERAGRAGEALAAAAAVRATSADPDVAARAALLEAEQHRPAGRLEEADHVLAEARPVDPGLRLLVDARRARSLAMRGRIEEALEACRGVARAAWSRPPSERIELVTNALAVLALLGRLSEGRDLIRRLDADRSCAPFATRNQIATFVVCAIESGELAEARGWLERLGPTRSNPRLHVHALLSRIRLRAASGEIGGIVDLLEEVGELCERTGEAEFLGWSRIADVHCGIILGELRTRPWPAELPPIRAALGQALDACVRIARRRLGQEVDAADDMPCAEIDLELYRRRDVCEEALLHRHLDAARRTLGGAIELARRYGYALHELDLLALGADLHLTSGSRDRAAHFAGELRRLAERVGSPRFVAEAELAEALVAGEPPAADLLERLGAMGSTSPVAVRRARALLGGNGRLDAMDRLVLSTLPARGPAPAAAASPRGTTWSFDSVARTVSLPGPRVVDLQNHAVPVRILEVLRRAGTAGATKEDLAREVWDVRDYHPLRDDKRLHVAVRRLRVLLEDDHAKPTRLVTTDGGYAVRGVEPEGR